MRKILAILSFVLFGIPLCLVAQIPSGTQFNEFGLYQYKDFAERDYFALGARPDPQIVIISKQVVNDYQCVPNPGNPPSGNVRVYCDSGTGLLTCLNSSGLPCTGGGTQITNAVYAANPKYNLPGGGFIFCDATFNAANATVTVGNDTNMVDPPFVAGMVGWGMFTTNDSCINPNANGAVGTPGNTQTTIFSVNSPTSITQTGGNSTRSCSSGVGSPNCTLVIYPADSATALNAAWADTEALGPLGCGTLIAPVGIYAIGAAIHDSASPGHCATDNTENGTYFGAQVKGQGSGQTVFVSLPSLDATSCINGCFFSNNSVPQNAGLHYRDFGISGAGNIVTGINLAGHIGLFIGQGGYAENIAASEWGIGTGIQWNGVNAATSNGYHVFAFQFGLNEFNFGGINGFGYVNTCKDCNASWSLNGANATINAPTYTSGSTFAFGGAAGCNVNITAGDWTSVADTVVQGVANSQSQICVQNTGKLHAHALHVDSSTGGLTNVNGIHVFSGGIVDIEGSAINSTAGAGGVGIKNDAGGTVVDNGANTISGSANSVSNAGTYSSSPTTTYPSGSPTGLAPSGCAESAGNGTCALLTGSTNEKGTVRITAGTTTLLNPSFSMNWAGTFVGATTSAPSCQFFIQNTGTGSWITAAPAAFGLPMPSAISNTAVTVNIATTVNTVSTSTYDVGYICTAK